MSFDRIVAGGLVALALYIMSHAILLPIGWNGQTGGPGGGAFPFWGSLIILICGIGVFVRPAGSEASLDIEFDKTMIKPLLAVIASIAVTIALIPIIGAYFALPAFLFWYTKIFGKHSWTLSVLLSLLTPVGLFFFFEVTLKILLPKGITEPFFVPFYAIFF